MRNLFYLCIIILCCVSANVFALGGPGLKNNADLNRLSYDDNPNGQFLIGFGDKHFHLGAGYYFNDQLMAFGQLDVGYRFKDLGFGLGGGVRPVKNWEIQLGASYLILDRVEQNSNNNQTEQITAILALMYHVSEGFGIRLAYTHNLGINIGVGIKF